MYLYKASEKDFKAIEVGIQLACRYKRQIFPFGLNKIDIVIYDSKDLYVWSKSKRKLQKIRESIFGYNIYKIPHNKKLKKKYFYFGGATPQELLSIIKTNEIYNFFSCAPFTVFIKLQKLRKWKQNPYTTRESYSLTMVHEFAHAYYNLFYKKIPILKEIKTQAKKFYKNEIELYFTICEAFAEYCELYVAKKFRRKYINKIRRMLKEEKKTPHSIGYEIALKLNNL